MLKVTTRISREEMREAQLADPRRKDVHWTRRTAGRIMIESIIKRMESLVGKISRSAFVRYCHGTDRAVDVEDIVATVSGELVLAIYRYDINGKYEPLNYLLGVVHVVLKNIHNRRNRKKRIPAGMLVSIDTPKPSGHGFSTLGEYLKESLPTSDLLPSLISRMEVERLFNEVNGRIETVSYKAAGREVKRKLDCGQIVKMILDGETLSAVSRTLGVPRHITRDVVRNQILPSIVT